MTGKKSDGTDPSTPEGFIAIIRNRRLLVATVASVLLLSIFAAIGTGIGSSLIQRSSMLWRDRPPEPTVTIDMSTSVSGCAMGRLVGVFDERWPGRRVALGDFSDRMALCVDWEVSTTASSFIDELRSRAASCIVIEELGDELRIVPRLEDPHVCVAQFAFVYNTPQATETLSQGTLLCIPSITTAREEGGETATFSAKDVPVCNKDALQIAGWN